MAGGSGFKDFYGGEFLEPRAHRKYPEKSGVDNWRLSWFLVLGCPRGKWSKVNRGKAEKRATGNSRLDAKVSV